MEYLTVKDVAALVRRNEETIRRMIRARKLDVELNNNNRHQGYMISVDQLVNTWDIKREDVEKYIQSQKRMSEEQKIDERIPLGPKRGSITDEIELSAHIIEREMNKIATLACDADIGEKTAMNEEYDKRNNIDGKDEPDRKESNEHEYFSADFSRVGERVSEIISDAYCQINRAIKQAGEACEAARKQAAEKAESARRAQQAHAEAAAETAEHTKEALNVRSAAIRDAIANACEKTRSAAHATGGWAESIRPIRKTDDDEQPEQNEQPDENAAYRDEVKADEEEMHAPEFRSEFDTNGDGKDESEYIPVGNAAMDEDSNASYQLLQAARRAVEARLQKNAASEKTSVSACGIEAKAANAEVSSETSESVQSFEATSEPVQMTHEADNDMLKKRISDLESQMSRLSDQLEVLTRRLTGDDK